MGISCYCFPKFKIMGCFQIMLGMLVIAITSLTLFNFYSAGFFLHKQDNCQHFYDHFHGEFDLTALSNRVHDVLDQLSSLQDTLESNLQTMENNNSDFNKFLEFQVIRPLYNAHIALRQIRIPKRTREEPLINRFVIEEIRKYITPKENRNGNFNVYGSDRVVNAIGHGCVVVKKELEEYMSYDVGSYCKDDWNLAQKLMIEGCDPLPRRRCLSRASKLYTKPYPINESLWRIPSGGNVRWANYNCGNFECLSGKNSKRGFKTCASCFEMDKEKLKWAGNNNSNLNPLDFLINDILAIKPGEIRIGIDYGIGTGTFAARMRENNVTIVSTAMNLGAPFNEIIALRGLIPLYATINQRLPFFDNTMDLIHTRGILDGSIDLQLMDFILFDWDRVLRPGGLLWVDRFFCNRKHLDDYMYMFLQFRYKKHKWIVSPKSKDDVFFSAVLEKLPRSL